MTASTPPAIKGSELCTKCGLCCHGVLHDRAHLAPEELGLAEELGLNVQRQNDDDWFELPCRHVCGNLCSVYERRPKVCAGYECGVLAQYKSGCLSLDNSLGIVAEVKRLLTELERVMPRSKAEGREARMAREPTHLATQERR
jgi:Fe-S-cluster containining protein